MKYALGSLWFAGALALSFGAARADVLVLTSSALKDNDQLAVKNACADKQRSPNCVGENISPPLAWSGAPEGTKSFAIVMLDPEGRAPAGVVHMVIYGIPGECGRSPTSWWSNVERGLLLLGQGEGRLTAAEAGPAARADLCDRQPGIRGAAGAPETA